MYAFYFICWEF